MRELTLVLILTLRRYRCHYILLGCRIIQRVRYGAFLSIKWYIIRLTRYLVIIHNNYAVLIQLFAGLCCNPCTAFCGSIRLVRYEVI